MVVLRHETLHKPGNNCRNLMNIPCKTLLLGTALLMSLGAFSTVSARTIVYSGPHRAHVAIVRPAPVYGPYYHHRHHVYVQPGGVYEFRPYHRFHRTGVIRYHRW